MRVSLSKNSDVPLRHQIAEQIVVLITTGQIEPGEQLPSVRALARRLKIHHNTVSEAYQDLVRRGWLTRQRGSRLVVGERNGTSPTGSGSLDELINEAIQRAKRMGYGLQALTKRVRERLQEQPADHVLVVEEEAGLRRVICHEVKEETGLGVEGCTPAELDRQPDLCFGAQVFAPLHMKNELKAGALEMRPPIWITYSSADEHVKLIQNLKSPSVIAAASVSATLLRTARSCFAPALGRRHAFEGFLLEENKRVDLRGIDVVFCDSIAMEAVQSGQRVHYRLISPACLRELASALDVKQRSKTG
jgi:GntR family transcriptional regulator